MVVKNIICTNLITPHLRTYKGTMASQNTIKYPKFGLTENMTLKGDVGQPTQTIGFRPKGTRQYIGTKL